MPTNLTIEEMKANVRSHFEDFGPRLPYAVVSEPDGYRIEIAGRDRLRPSPHCKEDPVSTGSGTDTAAPLADHRMR